uniref:hypothetical protein n=1 Tax=Empedobacter sp. TaxID=1927715 RepID=UPI00289D5486
FIHSLSILIIGIHMPFGESSKKLTKKDLAVNLSTKNVLIPLKILQTLRAKNFLTLHSTIFLT